MRKYYLDVRFISKSRTFDKIYAKEDSKRKIENYYNKKFLFTSRILGIYSNNLIEQFDRKFHRTIWPNSELLEVSIMVEDARLEKVEQRRRKETTHLCHFRRDGPDWRGG